MKKILFMMTFVILTVLPLMAGPIRVAFRDTTVLRGSTVYMPVYIDSSTTGLDIKSYELDISYSSGAMTIDSVINEGSMTSGWNPSAFHNYSGRITIAGAGTTPLDGTGILLYLKVFFPLTSTWPYGSLTIGRAYFNEGSPLTVVRNGFITIINIPVINISPDNALLTVGNTRQFTVSGGKSPYNWLTTDPWVATINGSGLLTAQHGGYCNVVAVDSNGITDTTSQIEVRSFLLTIRDTSYLQGQTINIPVYITDLSSVNVHSGIFSVSFNPAILTALGTVQAGTLLEPFSNPVTNITPGKITVAFAGDTSRLNGTGNTVLIYIRFKITEVNNYSTTLQLGGILFNELLTGNNVNGSFTVLPRPVLTVTPNTGLLIAGDSLQFSVSGGATPPINWSVSDTELCTISATGKLKAIKSGIIQVLVSDSVGARGTSGNITLYDMRIQLLNVGGRAGDTVDVAVQVGSYQPGIYSAQLTLTHNQNYITPLEIITSGTLFEGRMMAMAAPSSGTVNVTAAGAAPVTGPGVLLKIRFIISNSAPLGSYPVNFSASLLNEGKPLALSSNGQITVGTTGIENPPVGIPTENSLGQNYPNPFNPSTKIQFSIIKNQMTILKVYDLLGKEIATLVDETMPAGIYSVAWDAVNVPSGIYFYRLTSGNYIESKKLILMK